ncbi:MAG: glycosyltransferase family 4 protein [Acidimicrobiales bacterium]
MRVLVLSQYFPPEVGATQTRVELFARRLAEAGHDVTVVAEVPNHPLGVVFDGWRGRLWARHHENGYAVVRVWVRASARKSFWRRITFYLSYSVNAVLAALLLVRRRPDVIFASSPPLPVLVSAWALAAVWRRPYVADIRDVWPAVGIALGELRGRRAAALAQRLERALYRGAAAVTCVTRGFVAHVARSGVDPGKVHHLPNGTLPAVFDPARRDEGLSSRLGLEGRFVVGYVGLHGIAQGLGSVLEAAALLRNEAGVRFLFVGDGPAKQELRATARRLALGNVVFCDQVPTERVAAYINACDVLVVPLRRLDILSTFVPSKLFDFWCCAKPVILMVDGEARAILDDAGAGVYVEAENAGALAAAVRDLRDRPADAAAMGERGRAHVLRHFDRDTAAVRLEELLRVVAGCRKPGAGVE